ncbi:MAG: DUF2452 domain-containing protein [Myxococcota bacterium]
MADEDALERHSGPRHPGPARSSPYPVSRLAPTHDLVDIARQIAEADQIIGTVTHGKLEVIAEQIRGLQNQARRIMDEARANASLHRARCNFQKRVGHTYHLYEKSDGSSYLSMLGPQDWGDRCPDGFAGSYRLEADMSWTPAGNAGPQSVDELRALTGVDAPR